MDDRKLLDVVFLDFTVPFDAGSHSILMDELPSFVMSGFTLFLVKNWLKGRAERIVVNEMTSGCNWAPAVLFRDQFLARFVQSVCQKSG